MGTSAAADLKELSHFYGTGTMRRQVLQGVNLTVAAGEVVLLTGPSGCGKTTLLTLVGALRSVQEGSVQVLGQELAGASRRERQRLRRSTGMIFQGHNLLRCLTAEQNVQMGSDLLPGLSYCARRDQSREWLRAVGLGDELNKLPHDLSGGQKQRVAIARALIANPSVILADEPTGALDSVTSDEVMALLKEINGEGITIVVVTHENEIANQCDRIIRLKDGRIEGANA